MNSGPPRGGTLRRLLAVALSVACAVVALACDGGSSRTGGSPEVQSTLQLRLLGGSEIRGVQATIVLAASVELIGAEGTGPLAGAECGGGTAGSVGTAICATNTGFDGPATVATLTFEHPAGVAPLSVISSVACSVSDVLGTVTPVSCELLP